jgi:hypothetical protein
MHAVPWSAHFNERDSSLLSFCSQYSTKMRRKSPTSEPLCFNKCKDLHFGKGPVIYKRLRVKHFYSDNGAWEKTCCTACITVVFRAH